LMFKKYRLISFGIFWFFLTLSVESSIIPISQDVIYEHRTYLPGFGFFLAVTGAFFYFYREKYLHLAVITILIIATVNTALTYQRNKIWRNDYTLWADCVNKSPNKIRAHINLGVAYSTLGQYQLAITDFNEAIRLKPDLAEAYSNRGGVYSNLGQSQLAITDFNEAIRLKPDLAEAYSNRGGAYLSQSNNELGCLDAQKACELGNCQLLVLAKGKADCR
jgi:tetratricopeptide (TPR) repeat protein